MLKSLGYVWLPLLASSIQLYFVEKKLPLMRMLFQSIDGIGKLQSDIPVWKTFLTGEKVSIYVWFLLQN